MKRTIAVTIGSAALLLAAFPSPPAGAAPPIPAGIGTAQAAVNKSLGSGGGGDVNAAGDRLGGLLSDWGPPIVIALAGWFLVGALASRSIGSALGVILGSLVALIFFVSPQSIESLAKNLAETVF